MSNAIAVKNQSLIIRMADKFGVDPEKFANTIKDTCFRVKQKDKIVEISNEQLMALLIVAEQYGLNPWTKEIYAFPQDGGIVPIVGVDGWMRIINSHPAFDGVTFEYGPEIKGENGAIPVCEWIECTIHRKDRSKPTVAREYIMECRKNSTPWGSHPKRMLRHKALIQCARIAFGYAGFYDEDEAQGIIDATPSSTVSDTPAKLAVGRVNSRPALKTSVPAKITTPVTTKPQVEQTEPIVDEVLPEWVNATIAEIKATKLMSAAEAVGDRLLAEFRGNDVAEPDKVEFYPILFSIWAEHITPMVKQSDRPRFEKKVNGWQQYLGSVHQEVMTHINSF